MKYKVRKIEIIEESNELGTILIERLIERMLLKELGFPTTLQTIILSKHYREKDDNNVSK
ncbi:hypothetical protein [Metabacillus litoralis]|uniref:hypothetical protein n=1 Tax=Metabacillus litoralis TaxID=152268 RepID=UPI001CFDCC7E|nr:hypothetical protein [Metabacillus litoralis]